MALSWAQIKKMREDRAKLVEEGNKLLTAASEENRDMTQEEEARFDAIHADAEKLRKKIEQAEQQFYAERALKDPRPEFRGDPDDEPRGSGAIKGPVVERYQGVAEDVRAAAFGHYLRTGRVDVGLLSEEMRSNFGDQVAEELRALAAFTDASGGYGVPKTTHNRYVELLKEVNALERAGATVITVDANGKYDVPIINDLSNTGDMTAENGSDESKDPTFGVADLTDYRFDADHIAVSNQMLRSSVDAIESILISLMATRIGQAQQTKFTVGTGSSQPQGIVTGATVGKTATSETKITYDDLVDLQFSVIQTYRNMPSTGWMMADATLAAVRKIVDGDDRPIFVTSTVLGTPDMLLGKPVYTNNDMDSVEADKKPILFGAFSYYWIKKVGRVRVIRDPYSASGKDQVVFHAFHDAGGALVNAQAVKSLQMDDGA